MPSARLWTASSMMPARIRASGFKPSTSESWRMVAAASFCTLTMGFVCGPIGESTRTPMAWISADASAWTATASQ